MKKVLSICLLALVVTASVAAGGGSQSSSGKETLRVITYFAGADQWAPTWKEVIADYMAKNPNVFISDESVPTAGTTDVFRPKMNADAAAKTPADIALYFNGSDAKPMLESGLYVTWEEILAADPKWRDTFSPGVFEAGKWDGQLISLPYIGYFEGLLYNARLFRQYNLNPPDSWENILKAVEVFSKTNIVPIASTLLNPTAILETILLAEVGPEGQKKFFDDSWAPALERFKTLYQMNAFPKDAATVPDADLRPLFANGSAAIAFNGSWVLNSLRDDPDMRIIPVSPPPGSSGVKGAIIAGFGSGWYMSKAAYRRSGEALKFIKWMCSPEVLARFIKVGGSPAMPVGLPPDSEPIMLSAMDLVGKATSMSPPLDAQIPREVFNKFNRELISVCVGDKTALQFLRECRALLAQHQ